MNNIWERLNGLEREVYKIMNPNWKDIVDDGYRYIRDIKKIKELFKYKRIGLEIEDDGSVSVRKAIRINQINDILDNNGHLVIKFNKSYDDFFSWSQGVKSLEGFPNYVGDTLGIINASIKNLIGCPRIVNGDCFIENCYMLESVEGLPEQVGGNLVLELDKKLLKVIDEKYVRAKCMVKGTVDVRGF